MKIEISNGELIDKVCILAIKLANIQDPKKRHNIIKEFDTLNNVMVEVIDLKSISKEFKALQKINEALWGIEDTLRIKEKKQEFDQEFIELARSVYFTNDKRSEIKRQINLITKSKFVEEKSYQKYS